MAVVRTVDWFEGFDWRVHVEDLPIAGLLGRKEITKVEFYEIHMEVHVRYRMASRHRVPNKIVRRLRLSFSRFRW